MSGADDDVEFTETAVDRGVVLNGRLCLGKWLLFAVAAAIRYAS